MNLNKEWNIKNFTIKADTKPDLLVETYKFDQVKEFILNKWNGDIVPS